MSSAINQHLTPGTLNLKKFMRFFARDISDTWEILFILTMDKILNCLTSFVLLSNSVKLWPYIFHLKSRAGPTGLQSILSANNLIFFLFPFCVHVSVRCKFKPLTFK